MACPLVRAQISEETRLACFHPLPETPLWRAALNKLSDTLFYNDTIRHRGRMLLSTVLPLYADRGLMKTYFGIAENDLCGQLYFLVLHVWLLHRRLVALQDELTRDSLWEAVDDVYRAILCEEKVSEMRISSYVREMQRTALGFCLALDEAFDEACFAGEAAHRIWYVVYGADDASRYAPHVLDLTAYLLRTSQFVADIPVDLLYRGSFSWPRWPPHIEGLSALEPTEAGEQKTFFKKM
ncbi:hypothetical protein BESB_069610 [Besnoitia besnoiti]|uniref:Ubiquinol-cytochrome c chaperone domain-containing protein n=1 Tax=Besnoitia besnoiti TaxID=94643 RepID=A0A2A9M8W6_BESBE|nr:hypothetical protein BESB_069610 [Besnoitia besnoiti]PFH34928.1 hypothetical protein BESB_069610 [Besnoitia besnoiti]